MSRSNWFLLAVLVIAPLSAHAELTAGGGPSWNGFMVRFVTKLEPPGINARVLLPGAILSDGTGVAHHVINDDANKRTFGYDLRLDPAANGRSANLRIEPLHAPEYSVEAGWTLAALPQYPVIPNVKVGDTVALDLLVNPTTGQKITDYLTLERPDRPDASRAHDFSLDDVQLTLDMPRISINGQLMQSTSDYRGGISGTVVWLYLQGRGRFVFSLFPDEKFGFRKTGVTNTSVLVFRDGSDEYRIECTKSIAPGDGPFNVYIVREPDWKPYFPSDLIELGGAGKPGSVFGGRK